MKLKGIRREGRGDGLSDFREYPLEHRFSVCMDSRMSMGLRIPVKLIFGKPLGVAIALVIYFDFSVSYSI